MNYAKVWASFTLKLENCDIFLSRTGDNQSKLAFWRVPSNQP